jgi:hypothetical protein
MRVFFKELNIENIIDSTNYNYEEVEVSNGTKLYQVLLDYYPLGFDVESSVLINKKEIKLQDYDIELNQNDIIIVNSFPEYNFLIMIAINIVISLIISYLFKPKEPDITQSRSIYSMNVNQIEAKLGEPIQIQYGTIRQYPKLIAPGYKIYSGNEEFSLLHTCVGVGNYNILETFIGETNVNNFTNSKLNTFTKKIGSKLTFLDELKTNFNTATGINKDFFAVITHKPAEISSINLDELNQELGYSVINARKTMIEKILINFEFSQGIYGTHEETDWLGNAQIVENPETASFQIIMTEINDEDAETGFKYTENFSITQQTRSLYRESKIFYVKEGRYKIYIKRTDATGATAVKKCSIQNVIGMEKDIGLEKSDNLTLTSFLVRTSQELSLNSELQININSVREYDINGSYTTLYDFVRDVWTNPVYGMNESLEYLDIREQLDETVSLVLDKKENAFDTMSSVLKSFGYRIYPYLNKFVIKKEAAQLYRSIIFSNKNCKDVQFSYKLQNDDEQVKGVKSRYLKAGDINFSNYYFPDDISILDYDETVLIGVDNEAQAKKISTFLYDKKTKILKNCQLTTDLEGLIPEIGQRVGVATEYIDNFITAEAREITGSVITLNQNVKFLSSKTYYVLIETESNTVYNVMQLKPFLVDSFTDTIELLYDSLVIDETFFVSIGDRIEVVEDYVISSIQPSGMNENIGQSVEVKLVLSEYIESIYQSIA